MQNISINADAKTIKASTILLGLRSLERSYQYSLDRIEDLKTELEYNGEEGYSQLDFATDLLSKEITKIREDIEWWVENGDQEI